MYLYYEQNNSNNNAVENIRIFSDFPQVERKIREEYHKAKQNGFVLYNKAMETQLPDGEFESEMKTAYVSSEVYQASGNIFKITMKDDGYDMFDIVVRKIEPEEERKEKYYVTFKVEGRFIAEVNADSVEDAKKIATDMFSNADFGSLEDIDAEPVFVEDERGDYLWKK